MSEISEDPGSAEQAIGEVYVDTARLPEIRLMVQSGSADAYLQAIGIDPSILEDGDV